TRSTPARPPPPGCRSSWAASLSIKRVFLSVISSTCLDGPHGLDSSAAVRHALTMQVHCRAAVGRQDLASLSDLRPGPAVLDLGVLLCQSQHLFLRLALDRRRAEVLRDRLAAGIEDIPTWPPADDRARDRQRAGKFGPSRMVGTVHQQERSRLNLRDAIIVPDDGAGPCPRSGDHLNGDAIRFEQPPRPDQFLQTFQAAAALVVWVGHHLQVTVIPLQSDEAQPLLASHVFRQLQRRRARLDPAAAHAAVHLDQHADRHLGRPRRLAHLLDVARVIHADADLHSLRQLAQPPQLLPADNLVGDEDVGDAGVGEYLRLVQLGAEELRHPLATQIAGESAALQRLEVNPNVERTVGKRGPHALEIGVEDVEVDEQLRRFELVNGRHGILVSAGIRKTACPNESGKRGYSGCRERNGNGRPAPRLGLALREHGESVRSRAVSARFLTAQSRGGILGWSKAMATNSASTSGRASPLSVRQLWQGAGVPPPPPPPRPL